MYFEILGGAQWTFKDLTDKDFDCTVMDWFHHSNQRIKRKGGGVTQ